MFWNSFQIQFMQIMIYAIKMATTSTTRKSSKKHSFKWTPKMVEDLMEVSKVF